MITSETDSVLLRTLYRCAADSRAAGQPILIIWSSLIVIVIIITVIQIF